MQNIMKSEIKVNPISVQCTCAMCIKVMSKC